MAPSLNTIKVNKQLILKKHLKMMESTLKQINNAKSNRSNPTRKELQYLILDYMKEGGKINSKPLAEQILSRILEKEV